MAGQSIERRDMMRILALAAAASAFPGFRRWTFACEHLQPENSKTNTPDSPYQPQFCSPDEYALVERLSELIIPTDDKPGAREAGVSEFVDFRIWTDPSIQEPFRYGLSWISAHGIKLYGKPFLQLAAEQRPAGAHEGVAGPGEVAAGHLRREVALDGPAHLQLQGGGPRHHREVSRGTGGIALQRPHWPGTVGLSWPANHVERNARLSAQR